ncbi:MAG TPA: type I restriction endonuclease [Bacilli bacterium]|mgnify:CR=1 FL=1|nr:type I restriction endonuclease [Bacilli bacterium]
MKKHLEKNLEDRIEVDLIGHLGYNSYTKDDQKATFDPAIALNPTALIDFVKASQPKEWDRHVKHYTEPEKAFIERFDREVRVRGIIDVLRQGIEDRGVKFIVVQFTPNTTMNETLNRRYLMNNLQVARQLHYSAKNPELSLDIVLFINGIPLVTLELKNQYSGQDVTDAIRQYKIDRDPTEPIFKFKRRTLVHFAVDPFQVYMTTQLEGKDTIFLPFNQGSNGGGNIGGVGNPINEDNYDTAYLWETVLRKENLLDILSKYIHHQKIVNTKTGDTEKEAIIFPRYHQLDVVTKLMADVRQNKSGHNYLIQHSAGSGKSNTIAWLAYRLSSLHIDDKRVFNSIIVVTDRRVLDKQLQDTIYQFDHVSGVVEKIDKGKTSRDLLKAINEGKDIIITTIQKFPNIYKEIIQLDKNYAIIVDEAHQSTTGETARALKAGLANTDDVLKEYARLQEEAEEKVPDDTDAIIEEMLAHGHHKNLSFFAFTATPKNKTLQMFGVPFMNGDQKQYRPFHIYSMRQAIEEEFILDVLKNYMTYDVYFKIAKKIQDDPTFDMKKAGREVIKYQSLHPYNISQKTAIILDHFNNVTKYKIDGKAKAMVVTASRLHAVRYYYEFIKQIKEKHLTGLDVLVAFSGEVTDPDTGEVSFEEGINVDKQGKKIREGQLPHEFKKNFNCLIVAEKYQTGFDEPLLHTMFVDKRLTGVKAVQTLSRLNRIYKGKNDTFVLDFVNTAEEIQESFQPYYEETILESETNPNTLYDIKNQLDALQVYKKSEIDSLVAVYKDAKELDASKFSNFLKPALDRYRELTEAQQAEFKTGTSAFLRLYNFITSIERLFDTELHKFFTYIKFLRMVLPKEKNSVYIDDKIELEYYKTEQKFFGDIKLEETSSGVAPISGVVVGRERKKDKLSVIIDRINLLFSTHFSEMDKVLLQLVEDMVKDPELSSFGKNNDQKTFGLIYNDYFKKIIIDRAEQNNEFFDQLANDEEFRNIVSESLLPLVFERIRKGL